MPTSTPHTTPRRAFLHLIACVSLSLTFALGEVWALGARQRRGLRGIEIQLDLDRILEQIRILSAWFERGRQRPRYSPREVLLILEHAERYGLSAAEIARDVLVSPSTVYRWRKHRREAPPGTNPFAQQAKPVPPCRRICDSRRDIVVDMAVAGFAGNRTIERHLRHQGEKVSARSVCRFRHSPVGPPKEPEKPRKRPKETPELLDACARYLPGPEHLARPRLARLIRTLADAFSEGIAANTLRQLDEGSLYEDDHARLRSRRAEQLAILHARLSRIPPRHRPRYADTERAEILALKYRFRLSNRTLAAWFLLDENTISDWNRDVDHADQRQRPLVQPMLDLETAIASVTLPPVPKRLQRKVAETLATLAQKVLPRRRRTQPTRQRDKPGAEAARPRKLAPIQARHPNHYWTSDLTTLELGRTSYLATILDLHSRDVLAWDLFAGQPSSEQVTALFDSAVSRHGNPKHFVSDQGGQFLGDAFEAALADRGIDHRRGAVGQHGSIAIIERLWRTAKECLDLKAARPNVSALLRERIAVVIDYYNTKRPHTALGNATPAETYRGEPSRAATATPAPRGWRGEASPPPPFVIRHAFPDEKKLPYLERVA